MKASTKKKIISQNTIPADSIVFFDAMVLLGTAGVNQSKTPLRLVGYQIENELRFQPVDTMNQEYRKNLMEHRNVPGVQRENENTRDAFSIDQVSLKFTVSRGTG